MRESRSTPNGPRSRTLATFRELSDEVVEKARARSEAPPEPGELRAAAIRAGAPLAPKPLNRAASETLRLLAGGEAPNPMLRSLLLDALGAEQPISAAARAAARWVGAGLDVRGEALRELLELADALPPSSSKNQLSLPQKIVALDELLDASRVPHAFGGAFAIGFYGEPRMTLDIDVNVFVSPERWRRIAAALAELNIEPESQPDKSAKAVLRWESNPVDVFFSQDELHDEMRRAARRAPFAGTAVPVVSPEHLIVRKAMLDRTKDWLDIEQILVATSPLDLDEIETWLERMVGPRDERRARFQAMWS